MSFASYTDAILSALQFNPKANDAIARKQEILDGVYQTENLTPTSILFVGFNPAILSTKAKTIAVTEISSTALDYVKSVNPNVQYIPESELSQYEKRFQCVIAMDEYFTFAETDKQQQDRISQICSLATEFVISTIRDYKNQDFKEREFSQPALIKNSTASKMFLEYHNWDLKDRTLWNTTAHEINSPDNTLTVYGPFVRRTMYFKQLAKFSIDSGATNFFVHKNLMYKSLIKKNYEHVVSIQFN
jgi:hypothetical protein